MKQVLIRQGRAVVEEMPAPLCGRCEVLVRARCSVVSAGTEAATLSRSVEAPAAGTWVRRAKKAGEVLSMARERGIRDTIAAVEARLQGESLLIGYSLAGSVIEVGEDVTDLVPGQAVACAGASSAHHAEIVSVPRNLVVPIPVGLPMEHAAWVTLGAIALHGVRQADLRLGEIACVLGLGLLGQISVALLRASGCRTFGADISPARVARAKSLGLELGVVVGQDDVELVVDRASAGHGVDGVVLTAATDSSEPIRQAVRLVRRRGRIVVVGAVGMDIDRSSFYMKEAELRIACSYGPGRYDPAYEKDGHDYPYSFVRWTENRNMEEFLRLAASGAVPLAGLLDRSYALEEAPEAFRALIESPVEERPLGLLLRYPKTHETAAESVPPDRSIPVVPISAEREGIGVALVGPGNFASETHLPNLAKLGSAATLRTVVARTAGAAREASRRWGAAFAATDLEQALADDGVHLLLICTRHDLHTAQAVRALEAGKAVFLEKPAALDLESLDRLAAAIRRSGRPFTVGFNRRFAPDIVALRALLEQRRGPLVLTYRVNAGRLPQGHWTLGAEGGGRLVGEACHMIDLMRHVVGLPAASHALTTLAAPSGRGDLALGENFVLSCRYEDGSIAALTYTSLGHPETGKERIEAHWDGRTATIDDFRGLVVSGHPRSRATRPAPDKGHRELLSRFVAYAAGAGPQPIPTAEILEISRFVLELDIEARGRSPRQEA